MKKKVITCLGLAAVMCLTACGGTEGASGGQSVMKSAAPEISAAKANSLPEIPVTNAEAFKYEYNSEMQGMVITDYLKESPKVHIPDTLENEPVVGVDLSECEKQLTHLILPDSVVKMSLSDVTEKSLEYIKFPADGYDYNVWRKNNPDDGGYGGYYTYPTESEYYENTINDAYRSPFGENLTDIDISEKSERFSAEDGMFYYDYNGSKILLVCPQGKSGSITVLSGTTEIGNYAFQNCKKITSVTIPDGVTKIGDNAFSGCEKLTSVAVPDSVSEIGEYAFLERRDYTSGAIYDSDNEISVTYKGKTYSHDTLGELYDLLMYGDTGMDGGILIEKNTLVKVSENAVAIEIPDTVTEIKEGVFDKCDKLEKIKFKKKTYTRSKLNDLYAAVHGEEGLTIKEGVLTKVSPDLTEVKIPDRVTSISSNAFKGCNSLKKLTFGRGIEKIPDCDYNFNDNKFADCSSLEEIVIPESVSEIGDGAFGGLTALTKISLPKSLTYIGMGVFYNCKSLKSIDLPNGLKTIGVSVFSGCTSLKNVGLPDSVSSVAHGPQIDAHVTDSRNLFTGNEQLTVTYKGKSYDFAHQSELDKAINGDMEGLTIENGVLTNVSPDLTEVKIPDRVTNIAGVFAVQPAFTGCNKLTKVTFGKGITKISGNYEARTYVSIIYGGNNVEEIIIPKGVTSIDCGVFAQKSNLKKAALPEGLKEIGVAAFQNCTSLTDITIPDSVTSIAVHKEHIDKYAATIEYAAFEGCEKIKATYKGKTYDYAHINALYKAINKN